MSNFTAYNTFDYLNIADAVNASATAIGGGSFQLLDQGISYVLSGPNLIKGANGLTGTITSLTGTTNSNTYITITGLNHNAASNYYDSGYTVDGITYHGMTAEIGAMLNGDDVITGSVGGDILAGFLGNDTINGNAGNDTLNGQSGNDILDGGTGFDTATFHVNQSAVTEVRHFKAGGAYILSADGADTLTNIETLQFLDGSISAGTSGDVIRDLIATRPMPTFAGAASAPTLYTGGVAFLEYQYIGTNSGDTVTGASGNDFMNLGLGDDAANGGAGDDVIDGGVGSNFLTGGGGNDTLFLDGRGGTTTWATVTDFNAGDAVNIWGWVAGTSKLLLTQASNGAAGFTGVTYHYDLDNNGIIDTSITFTGLTSAQIPASQALSVAGNGYLLIG